MKQRTLDKNVVFCSSIQQRFTINKPNTTPSRENLNFLSNTSCTATIH